MRHAQQHAAIVSMQHAQQHAARDSMQHAARPCQGLINFLSALLKIGTQRVGETEGKAMWVGGGGG